MKGRVFLLVFFFLASAFSYTLSEAERAYVAKDWKVALSAFSEVCPTLSGNAARACLHWHILALSQTGDAKDFQRAGKKLDSLLSKMSPRDSLYSDFLMTRAQFEIYLKKFSRAQNSIRMAAEVSSSSGNLILSQVCSLLENADKSTESKSLCDSLRQGLLISTVSSQENSSEVSQAVSTSEPRAKNESLQSASNEVVSPNKTPAENSNQKSSEQSAQTSSESSIEKTQALAETASNENRDKIISNENSVESEKKTSESGAYYLQVGAFGKKENAEALLLALRGRKISAQIVENVSSERVLYLVWTQAFESRASALEYGEKVLAPLKMEFSPVKKP